MGNEIGSGVGGFTAAIAAAAANAANAGAKAAATGAPAAVQANSVGPIASYQAPPVNTVPTTITENQADQIATDVLDTGVRRFRGDDYGARQDAFAQAVEGLDAESTAMVFDAILEKDSGALNSWLSAEQIDGRVASGDITAEQRTAIANGLLEGYNNGSLSYRDVSNFLDTFAATQNGPALLSIHSPEIYNRPMEWIAAADPTRADTFRADFAGEMLDNALDTERFSFGSFDASYAADILSRSNDPGALAEAFAGLDTGARGRLLDALGREGIAFLNADPSLGATDPLISLMDSLASGNGGIGSTGQTYDGLAVETARFVGEQTSNRSDMFIDGRTPIDARAEAAGRLISAHGEEILTALTEFDISSPPGSTNGDTVAYQNAEQLAGLLRITAFNPENSQRDAVLAEVGQFAEQARALVNDIPNNSTPDSVRQQREDAINALKMLGIAGKEAVDQAFDEVRSDAAARAAFVGFVVDVALAPVPGGLSGRLGNATIAGLFGDQFSKPITDALNSLAGGIYKPGTNALTAEAKQAIADALGDSGAGLDELRANADLFITNSVLDGLTVETSDIEHDILSGAEDLRVR